MSVWTKAIAEFTGTMLLVLVGTGSIISDETAHSTFGTMGIALFFGAIVALMILCFGKISGAHLNPAVTLFVWLNKGIHRNDALFYFIMQISGACAASMILKLIFPDSEFLGATLPKTTLALAFGLEFLMTLLLLGLIVLLHKLRPHQVWFTALSIGILIFLEAWLGGPFTGASMNPARSFGPALISGHPEYLWLYFLAPTGASLMAALLFRKG